jgi:hypothetical protein
MITFSAAVEYIRSEKLRCSGTVLAAGEYSEYPM